MGSWGVETIGREEKQGKSREEKGTDKEAERRKDRLLRSHFC